MGFSAKERAAMRERAVEEMIADLVRKAVS